MFPFLAAKCKGVHPKSSFEFKSDFFWHKYSTIWGKLLLLAICKGILLLFE